MNEQTNRNRIIIKTSIIGIVSNAILAGFKAVIGTDHELHSYRHGCFK